MTYKQLKWLILLIPTITVGLWEYVRHEYLLPYISMDLGNWLTPVIVLFVTFTLLTRFFNKLEIMQEELRIEREEKAVLEERERIARDLHDGMAQSLFLLSVKVKQLEKLKVHKDDQSKLAELHHSIVDIHHYVRSGIENLRQPSKQEYTWLELIYQEIQSMRKETNINVIESIDVEEALLTSKEKMELTSCIKEALVNVRKHANASKVMLEIKITTDKRYILIKDDGIGFDSKDIVMKDHYGVQMMYESCKRINWVLQIKRNEGMMILYFSPERSVRRAWNNEGNY